MKIKLGVTLVLAFFAFVFISQNTETVRIDFFAWSTEMSIVLLVFIILAVGVIIGWLLNSYLRFAGNRKQAKAREAVQAKAVAKPGATGVATQGDKESHE